jgi:hypothetical protein
VATGSTKSDATEVELVSIFMKGLLSPEFDAIKLYISMMKISLKKDYLEIVDSVINFAQDQGLMDLKRGAGANARMMLMQDRARHPNAHKKDKKDTPCRFFARGTCTKGKGCDFSHSKPSTTTEGKTDKKFLKGSCYNCGDKTHIRPKCPLLKKEKEGVEGQPRNFMMRFNVITTNATEALLTAQNSLSQLNGLSECTRLLISGRSR